MTRKWVIFFFVLFISSLVAAERPVFIVVIEKHLFYPSEIRIPANTKVRLVIKNKDSTPEQFDSFDLNREKVIFPESEGTVYIGPLPKGEYQFFGEYNPSSAIGKVVVLEHEDAD